MVTSGKTSTLTGLARARVSIPFLDLAEAAWRELPTDSPVGLHSTSDAARGGIFQAAAERRGATLLPPPQIAERLDRAIFGDLVCGAVTDEFLGLMREAMTDLARQGAGAILLGNTDMTLAAERLDRAAPVPLVDSARAHARSAARAALSGGV